MVNPEVTQEVVDRVHPLAGALVIALDERGYGPDLTLSEEDVSEVREGLVELYGQQELRDAVRGLLNLGAFLQEQGAEQASTALYDVLAEQPLLDALDALNAERQEQAAEDVAKSSDALRKFAGADTQKKAPQVGEKKPDGALSLDQLKFPKRL